MLLMFGSGAAAFSPSDVVSKLFWYKSDGMVVDGSQWTDSISGNNLLCGGLIKPVYHASGQNSKPYFSCGATPTSFFQRAAFAGLAGCAKFRFYVVGKRFSVEQDDNNVHVDRTNFFQYDADDNVYAQFTNAIYGNVADANAVAYWEERYNGAGAGNTGRLKVFKNTAEQTLGFAGTIPATTQALADQIFVVGAVAGGTLVIPGDVYEIFCALDPTAGEQTSLDTYFMSRFAL